MFDDNEVTGHMNEFFTNIGEKLAKNRNETEQSPNEYKHRVTPTTGHIDYITENAVDKKLRKLNVRNKAKEQREETIGL